MVCHKTCIGNLLMIYANVSQEDLLAALQVQEDLEAHCKDLPGRPLLGQILVDMGCCAPGAIDQALKRQADWRRRGGKPPRSEVRRVVEFAIRNTREVCEKVAQTLNGLLPEDPTCGLPLMSRPSQARF